MKKKAKVVRKISSIRNIVSELRSQGGNATVGLVPTMGALHEGHLSLIKKSASKNQITIVSIFVNPTQFNDANDFESYPDTFKEDKLLAEESGADYIFAPSVEEMYPGDFYTFVDIEEISTKLCGSKRDGHFRGVCTVVSKLFNIVKPDYAYFGEKDIQQLTIIKKMVSDLNFDLKIVGCHTIREDDGLAMSSRNVHLSSDERESAAYIYLGMKLAGDLFDSGEKSSDKLIKMAKDIIETDLTTIDYIEIVDPVTLKSVDQVEKSAILAVAVFIGKTRLIDNYLLKD